MAFYQQKQTKEETDHIVTIVYIIPDKVCIYIKTSTRQKFFVSKNGKSLKEIHENAKLALFPFLVSLKSLNLGTRNSV